MGYILEHQDQHRHISIQKNYIIVSARAETTLFNTKPYRKLNLLGGTSITLAHQPDRRHHALSQIWVRGGGFNIASSVTAIE